MLRFCKWQTLTDINAKSFIDWRNSDHGYAIRTQNHYFDSVRVFLNWIERVYEIPNPLKRIQKLEVPKLSSNGPRAFTEEELRRLYDAAPRRSNFYRLMACTGLRHKEIRRLCWGDIALNSQPVITLRPEATKSRRADQLPIFSELVPELRAMRPVWAKDITPLFYRGVPTITTLHKDMARASISEKDNLGRSVGFHTFRRTFITALQKRNVPSRVIMQLARHKSLRFTDFTYTDATQLALTEGIEALRRPI
jgi:integrase